MELAGSEKEPDATTIWRFREALSQAGLTRAVGLVRAAAKIGLRNLSYNMDRLGLLLART